MLIFCWHGPVHACFPSQRLERVVQVQGSHGPAMVAAFMTCWKPLFSIWKMTAATIYGWFISWNIYLYMEVS